MPTTLCELLVPMATLLQIGVRILNLNDWVAVFCPERRLEVLPQVEIDSDGHSYILLAHGRHGSIDAQRKAVRLAVHI